MTELQKSKAPSETEVFQILLPLLPGLRQVKRVPEGGSTYVYRAETDRYACYARFLPEDATFGVEVLAHGILLDLGVPVPKILYYEPRERSTGLSLMVAAALDGACLRETTPQRTLLPVLREAGAFLAKLHTVPVTGFGWIDRANEDRLTGETDSFSKYFTEFLEHDLSALCAAGVDPEKVERVRGLMEEAKGLLSTNQARLVHGDFCLDHIFQKDGRFTGFIDFGEIRGNHPFFDLGAFALSDPTPSRSATTALLEGYGVYRPRDLRAVELSALAFALRFVGRKAGTSAESFWKEKLLSQLQRV